MVLARLREQDSTRQLSRQLVRGVHGIVSTDGRARRLVFLELRINLLVDRK